MVEIATPTISHCPEYATLRLLFLATHRTGKNKNNKKSLYSSLCIVHVSMTSATTQDRKLYIYV